MTWKTTQEFADWYIANGMPFRPPCGVEVFLSDDATAFCTFREGQFQVEIYAIHPQPNVPEHAHPGVEVIETAVLNSNILLVPVLKDGHTHGTGIREKANIAGYPLISIQRWHPNLIPTTIAAQWKGKTAGPLHEALIKRFHPNAYIIPGYADVTRSKDELDKC